MKKNLALIFGGPSAEHNISLVSAKCILAELDRTQFEVFALGIEKNGSWYLVDPKKLGATQFDAPISISKSGIEVSLVRRQNKIDLINLSDSNTIAQLDVAFPIVHGPWGEDGALQGFLKLLQIPFVGCDVTASALCMDKEFNKRVCEQAKIPVAAFKVYHSDQSLPSIQHDVEKHFKLPIYLKPANMGSSVGVHKVSDLAKFQAAAQDAFLYDTKILVEENIDGLEVEVAVLGNRKAQASQPGAFRANDDFYTYEAKYLNKEGATFQVPATNNKELNEKLREFALNVYKTLDCKGLSRVDLFLTADERIYLNEVNTLPGFTPISMYPKLWEGSGKPYSKLLSELVDLAFDEHNERSSKMQKP